MPQYLPKTLTSTDSTLRNRDTLPPAPPLWFIETSPKWELENSNKSVNLKTIIGRISRFFKYFAKFTAFEEDMYAIFKK